MPKATKKSAANPTFDSLYEMISDSEVNDPSSQAFANVGAEEHAAGVRRILAFLDTEAGKTYYEFLQHAEQSTSRQAQAALYAQLPPPPNPIKFSLHSVTPPTASSQQQQQQLREGWGYAGNNLPALPPTNQLPPPPSSTANQTSSVSSATKKGGSDVRMEPYPPVRPSGTAKERPIIIYCHNVYL
jgi:hypothetical protein